MVQIRPEPPLRRVPPEIGGGGGDDLDVHGLALHRPEPPDPLLVDGLQELALEGEGEGLDLVQEQRPSRRPLQQAGLGAFGIGERPGLKAKELGLQQRLRDGRAVDVDERPLGPGAAVVDDPRHQSFAGAGLALEEHCGHVRTADGVEGGQVSDLLTEGADRWGTPQEPVGRMARGRGAGLRHWHLPICTRRSDDHSHPSWPRWPLRWLTMATYG